MHCYQVGNQVAISNQAHQGLVELSEAAARANQGVLNILCPGEPGRVRDTWAVSDSSLVQAEREGLHLLDSNSNGHFPLPSWVQEKILQGQVRAINTAYSHWQEKVSAAWPRHWRVNILGLGDVGGLLATGLRLLGDEKISQLGIYARKAETASRWEQELNQIRGPGTEGMPQVVILPEKDLFTCDLFVFCASAGVPPVGTNTQDVRMAQWAGNSKLIDHYAYMARQAGFSGIFAVVSDPVDQLCAQAFWASNTNRETGEVDYLGLAPSQVRGYGLGVMHARACYFAKQRDAAYHYLTQGRAYGPHGRGLVIADSIENYDHQLSLWLTERALTANLQVRELGFKPFIAPALSSGTLALLATIQQEWHYSATYIGGVFMGARNRLLPTGVELERLSLPPALRERLENTYRELGGR